MGYPISRALNTALADALKQGADTHVLRKQAAETFDKFGNYLLQTVTEENRFIAPDELLRELLQTLQHDSVVRDVLTLGHLAKVLTRRQFVSSKDLWPIFGLPNEVFDYQSQLDRVEYFRSYGRFPAILRLEKSLIATQLVDFETALLKKLKQSVEKQS